MCKDMVMFGVTETKTHRGEIAKIFAFQAKNCGGCDSLRSTVRLHVMYHARIKRWEITKL